MGHDSDIVLPHIPGHELAGVVEAVGKDVRNWNVGDRVTVPFICGCGSCSECHAGHQQVCLHQEQPGWCCQTDSNQSQFPNNHGNLGGT
nr:alcohol dehydrogenase catalytic domain-containing protein [Ruegeria marisrubri]